MGLTMFPYITQFVLDLRQILYSVDRLFPRTITSSRLHRQLDLAPNALVAESPPLDNTTPFTEPLFLFISSLLFTIVYIYPNRSDIVPMSSFTSKLLRMRTSVGSGGSTPGGISPHCYIRLHVAICKRYALTYFQCELLIGLLFGIFPSRYFSLSRMYYIQPLRKVPPLNSIRFKPHLLNF